MRLLIMCDGDVGVRIASWLLTNYPLDLGLVVTLSENDIYRKMVSAGVATVFISSASEAVSKIKSLPKCDLGILVWWPRILSKEMLGLTRLGFINTHPSLLPFNRGKHYNFWALVEQSPFGVSLHFVDEGIDSGDIVAQKEILYDWTDTGGTLYLKAVEAMVELFIHEYPKIRELQLSKIKQDLTKGSMHYAREINLASLIEIDKQYKARDLINLLRARTFPGYPSCSFLDQGVAYDVTVTIKKHDVK